MPSFNKVLLMGNLTRDPEVRSLPSGQTVTELGVASNRSFLAGGPGGEKKEEVTFVDVTFWGKQGELIAQYLNKGDPLFIEGRLSFRQWEAKDGSGKRSKLSVTGENFQFVGGRNERSGGGGAGGGARGHESGASGGDDVAMEGFDEVPF